MPVDSHCHIHFKAFAHDEAQVVERSAQQGWTMITIGTSYATSVKAIDAAKRYAQVRATVGLHPVHLFSSYVDELEGDGFVSRSDEFDYRAFKELAQQPEVVAIGETGLDFYHIENAQRRAEEIEKQHQVFLEQFRLAHEVDKPLVIHCRDAYHELADLIEAHAQWLTRPLGQRGTVHCFTGNWEEAQRFLDLGFCIGFTGIITYKPKASEPHKQEALLEVVRQMPLDRMLVETDAPYLAPGAFRGRRCEPWMAQEVINKIAQLKGVSEQEIAKITSTVSARLFNL